jgi:hypothetical protein
MAKYGIENVRGGTYSNVVLDLDTNSIAILEKEIRHSKNLCTRCGRDSHYIKDCYAKTDVDGAIINTDKDDGKKDPVIKSRKKSWSSSDSDDSDDDCSDSDDSDDDCSDGGDETTNVLMVMTSGMLKNARKNRAII